MHEAGMGGSAYAARTAASQGQVGGVRAASGGCSIPVYALHPRQHPCSTMAHMDKPSYAAHFTKYIQGRA